MKELNLKPKKLINFRPLFFIFVAFFFGIVVSHRLFEGHVWYIVIVSLAMLVLVTICVLYKKFLTLLMLIVFFFAGTGAYFLNMKLCTGKEYLDKQSVVGRVTDNSKMSSYAQLVVLEDVFIGGEKAKNIYLRIYTSEEIATGSIVSFESYVNNVKLFELGNFNSSYYRNGVAYETVVNRSDVVVVEGNLKGDEIVRAKLKEVLYSNMSERNASTAFSVLTGNKNDLDPSVRDYYNLSGIIHLLTVSGLHITFLTALIAWILKKCKVNRWINLVVTGIILLIYAYFCGFSPSVVRAVIMGMVLIIAPILGKEYDSLSSLGLAGLIILLINPLSAYDGGFLMSFGSVLSIFLLNRPLSKILKKFLPIKIATTISVSICAQLGIIPFIAMYWGALNPLSFFINLLVIPFFSILFPFLFVMVFIAMIPHFGWVLKPGDWGFSGIYEVAKFFASTKTLIPLRKFDVFISVLFFVAIYTLSYFLMTKRLFKILVLSAIFATGSICYLVSNRMNYTSGVSVTYVSGNSLILTNSEGKVAYVGDSIYNRTYKWMYSQKIDSLDGVFYLGTPSDIENDLEYFESTYITTSSIKDIDLEVIASPNNPEIIDGFVYNYRFYEDKFIGIEIKFDNLTIFIASNSVLSYNSINYIKNVLAEEDFDMCFLGNKHYLSKYFVNTDNIFARYWDIGVDRCYQRDGNISINLQDYKQTVRCID